MIHLTGGLSQATVSGRNPNDTFDVRSTLNTVQHLVNFDKLRVSFIFICEKRLANLSMYFLEPISYPLL